jgi:hypothetical protein
VPIRSSRFALLFVVAAGVGLAACASHTDAPVFSTLSPADPKAPVAPPTRVEPLGQPAAAPSPGSVKPPAGGSAAPAQSAAPALYTCPMHAHVKSERPGSCPVCGMSLVKAKAKQ